MKCLLLGGTGFIGQNIIKARPNWSWDIISSKDYDLTKENFVNEITKKYDIIINSAGFYGGIVFNSLYKHEILYKNMNMFMNISKLVNKLKPKKFINIGSACIYPIISKTKLKENLIAAGNYHPSVYFSAMSKMWSLELTKTLDINWEYLIISNAYGPGEHTSIKKSHFVGSLINKIKKNNNSLSMLGTGVAVRDFIYIDDVAEAICRYCEIKDSTNSPTNIGTGIGVPIKEITDLLIKISNKKILLSWGDSKDDGVPYKILDNSKMKKDINFIPYTNLSDGLSKTWNWFKNT
jgi:GDP-L-fucose synthase